MGGHDTWRWDVLSYMYITIVVGTRLFDGQPVVKHLDSQLAQLTRSRLVVLRELGNRLSSAFIPNCRRDSSESKLLHLIDGLTCACARGTLERTTYCEVTIFRRSCRVGDKMGWSDVYYPPQSVSCTTTATNRNRVPEACL